MCFTPLQVNARLVCAHHCRCSKHWHKQGWSISSQFLRVTPCLCQFRRRGCPSGPHGVLRYKPNCRFIQSQLLLIRPPLALAQVRLHARSLSLTQSLYHSPFLSHPADSFLMSFRPPCLPPRHHLLLLGLLVPTLCHSTSPSRCCLSQFHCLTFLCLSVALV